MTESLQALAAWALADPARVIALLGSLVTIASIITAGTATPTPGSWQAKAYRVLEVLSLTIGKAKDTGPRPPSAKRNGPPPATLGVLALVVMSVALAGCSYQIDRAIDDPTPAQRVYALELDYQQAQRLALAVRPHVGAETWAHVQRLESVAYETLSAAREAARRGEDVGLPAALAAAREAIEALADYLAPLHTSSTGA